MSVAAHSLAQASYLQQSLDPYGRDCDPVRGLSYTSVFAQSATGATTTVVPGATFLADLGDLKHDDVALKLKFLRPDLSDAELLSLHRHPPLFASPEYMNKQQDVVPVMAGPPDSHFSVRIMTSPFVCTVLA